MKFLAKMCVVICLALPTICSALSEDEAKSWLEDINEYHQKLQQKHINLYHHIDKEEFSAELSQLRENLQSLTTEQVVIELMRITRLINDGHTQFPFWGGTHSTYPFHIKQIDNKIRIVATNSRYKQYLGWEILSIDGTPTPKILELLGPIVQGVENRHSLTVNSAWHFSVAELLYGLEVTKRIDAADFTLKSDSGKTDIFQVAALSMGEEESKRDHKLTLDRTIFSKPIILASESIWSKWKNGFSADSQAALAGSLWLSSDLKSSTAYIYFARYPSAQEMDSFAKNVQAHLVEHDLKHLIIDLRDNGGGDFFVGLRLAHHLITVDTLDWKSGIYVLTSNRTYSAGMSNAAQFRSILNATIVGEPTGANPVGYQDADGFRLTNSGRYVQYSKRYFGSRTPHQMV